MTRKRRQLALALASALTAARTAAAASGHYLEEEMVKNPASESASVQETTRTWIVAGKLRKEEVEGGSVSILRADRDIIWVLNVTDRTYFALTPEELAGVGAMGTALLAPGLTGDTSSWFVRSGREKKVGAWDSYEVEVKDRPLPGIHLSMWLARGVPLDRKLTDPFGGGMFGASSPAAKLLEGLKGLDGYPVEITLQVRMGARTLEMRQTLKKIESREIPDELFELPAGYRLVDNPMKESPRAMEYAPAVKP